MQYFPRAAGHLKAAHHAKAKLSSAWHDLLEQGLLDTGITSYPDGDGTITAFAYWQPSTRAELTSIFRECVDELWACLDSLVTESVMMFSILHRVRDPDAPRYFPIANSPENFAGLLEQSCLDGVLAVQYSMIRDCQPFQTEQSDVVLDKIRTGLRRLLDWSNRLDSGALIGAWATPADPEIVVEPSATSVRVQPQPPDELADELVVARFKIKGRANGARVTGRAGTHIDLAFPDGFVPAGPNDTFDARLTDAAEVVGMFAAAFARFVDKTQGAKRLQTADDTDPAAVWINARISPRHWTPDELTEVADSDLTFAAVRGADALTLIISTPEGTFERVVPDASPLPARVSRGIAAENAIQDAAATWGLPDFVLRPQQERKGSGVREVGDGLLVVGDRGVVVQAKSRDTESQTPDRESSWLTKKIAGAAKQADGTIRQLSSKPSQMINGRGRSVTVDGITINWITVIIIDHPNPPADFAIPKIDSRTPAVVVLRRDWEFLFNQLRSTYAVVNYLHRVGGSAEVLGGEPQRYYELAAADRKATTSPPAPSAAVLAGDPKSVPLLPAAPAGSDDNEAHAMVRIMCEDIADSPLNGRPEEDRLRVLAAIDRLPVGYRTDLGRLLLDTLRDVRSTEPGNSVFRFRTYRPAGLGDVQLGFGVCSHLAEHTTRAFESWFLLRHHERSAVEPLEDLMSVGVLLTPNRSGQREWDTSMLAVVGDPQLSPEELASSQGLWNTAVGLG